MTQIACSVGVPFGTVNRRMPVTVNNGADNSSQGRALPSGVWVRSMI